MFFTVAHYLFLCFYIFNLILASPLNHSLDLDLNRILNNSPIQNQNFIKALSRDFEELSNNLIKTGLDKKFDEQIFIPLIKLGEEKLSRYGERKWDLRVILKQMNDGTIDDLLRDHDPIKKIIPGQKGDSRILNSYISPTQHIKKNC